MRIKLTISFLLISSILLSTYIFLSQRLNPKYIIIHCIGYQPQQALEILTKTKKQGGLGVSSHYFIPAMTANNNLVPNQPIYHLVPNNKIAHHAGKSSWKSDLDLNNKAIGIEFNSPNYANALIGSGEDWFYFEPFESEQIKIGIKTIKSLIAENNIQPENILGHSDIAPYRYNENGEPILAKTDPGATFPWKLLAKNGVGVWPSDVRTRQGKLDTSIINVQNLLQQYGYSIEKTGIKDKKTSFVINAFQLHFLPEELGREPSKKMAIFLENLIDKQYAYQPFTKDSPTSAI